MNPISADTNYVTDNYPTLALYGPLIEAATWERDMDSVAMFSSRFAEAMAEANREADRAHMGAGPVASSHYQAPGGISRSM